LVSAGSRGKPTRVRGGEKVDACKALEQQGIDQAPDSDSEQAVGGGIAISGTV
jgi:hypothetical protein